MKKLINSSKVRTTEKAILLSVEIDDGSNIDLWFPLSMVSIEEMEDGTLGDIYVEDWILEQKEKDIGHYITNEDV